MNFTKEQRGQMKDGYEPQTAWNKLIEDCDELEKELQRISDTSILSAVPSDKELNEHAMTWFNMTKNDDFTQPDRCCRDFKIGVHWIIQRLIERGIAG